MGLDFASLKFIWWLLLGVVMIGFVVTDGFDLGVVVLLPFLGRDDSERRVVINTVGPVWEGNQVWLIVIAAASFAAWPALYALSFSSFYLAMLLVLAALILRPVGITYRSKMPQVRWRSVCDWALFCSGLVPAFVFGVLMGNLLEGVPFAVDSEMRAVYSFGFFDLFSPFALLCGVLSVAMLSAHGAVYLVLKTEGAVGQRARMASRVLALTWAALFALGGLWLWRSGYGLVLTGGAFPEATPNPLRKTVVYSAGAWLRNYGRWPLTTILPVVGLAAPLLVALLAGSGWRRLAFIVSSFGAAAVVGTVGVSLFPFLLPSSSHPQSSLTVWDASSSQRTLGLMLIAMVVLLPLILAYTAWVYHIVRGPVRAEGIKSNSDGYY